MSFFAKKNPMTLTWHFGDVRLDVCRSHYETTKCRNKLFKYEEHVFIDIISALWNSLQIERHVPTERREPTQQNVRDDTSCPDVDLEAVSVVEEEGHTLDFKQLNDDPATLNSSADENELFGCGDMTSWGHPEVVWAVWLTLSQRWSLVLRRWEYHTLNRGARWRQWPSQSHLASEIYSHRGAHIPVRNT